MAKLDVNEACAMLGVGIRRFRQIAREEKLPVEFERRKILINTTVAVYDIKDIQKLLQKRKEG